MRGVPPGRAGLLWLRNRLATAERAAELLETKLGALHTELERLEEPRRSAEREWKEQCERADLWLLRAALLHGRPLPYAAPARVEMRERLIMGIRYPAELIYRAGEAGLTAPEGVVLIQARRAAEAALAAACRYGAITTAAQRLRREAEITRRRVHAIRHRRLPQLHAAIAETSLRLEERDREDTVRLRHR